MYALTKAGGVIGLGPSEDQVPPTAGRLLGTLPGATELGRLATGVVVLKSDSVAGAGARCPGRECAAALVVVWPGGEALAGTGRVRNDRHRATTEATENFFISYGSVSPNDEELRTKPLTLVKIPARVTVSLDAWFGAGVPDQALDPGKIW
ncbi:MAG: hypothetical protein NVS9B1_15910 [Candidatus Dormibacteraceae bacterium]